MTQLSNRLNRLAPSATLAMSQRSNEMRAQGIDVVNMSVGEPDFNTPDHIKEAGKKAIDDNFSKYSPVPGYLVLREAIADKLKRENGLEYTPSEIIVGTGGKQGVCNTILALVNPGDEVVIPAPYWVSYPQMVKLAGGEPVIVSTGIESDFKMTPEQLENAITEKTKMIVVNNPSNPTGGVLSEESRKALADIAHDKDVMIMSDEVYESFVYEGRHQSFLPYLDRAVVVGGFSKMMAVTGWRLGFAIANEECMDALVKMQYHVCASPGMPAMYGVLNAMPSIDPYLENARATFKKRRDLISKRINEIDGMSIIPPKGAFYAFPSFDLDMTSQELANELVKAGLICTPGSAFGTFGEGHLRFSYAASEEKIDKGMDILADTVRKIKGGRI